MRVQKAYEMLRSSADAAAFADELHGQQAETSLGKSRISKRVRPTDCSHTAMRAVRACMLQLFTVAHWHAWLIGVCTTNLSCMHKSSSNQLFSKLQLAISGN